MNIATLIDSVDQFVDEIMNSTRVLRGANVGWVNYPNVFVYIGDDFIALAETAKTILNGATPCLVAGGLVFYHLPDVEDFITLPKPSRKSIVEPVQLELF